LINVYNVWIPILLVLLFGRELSQGAMKVPNAKEMFIDQVIQAMILVESDGRAHLRGRSGERGCMQIMRSEWNFTCKRLLNVRWHFDEAFNRQKNISVGSAYMRYLFDKYDDWELAVRAYNAGHRGAIQLNRGWKYLSAIKKTLHFGNTSWRKKRSPFRRQV